MHEKGHVIKVLEETKRAVNERDVLTLKDLSNRTIHSASVYQDTDSIAIAVVIYTLSKIIEREERIGEKRCSGFCDNASRFIENSIKSLKENKAEEFRNNLGKIRKSADRFPGDFRKDVSEVFRKASINKAAKIYEHGISMEQTADLLGLTLFELASYSGQRISETEQYGTGSVKERIKLATDFFK